MLTNAAKVLLIRVPRNVPHPGPLAAGGEREGSAPPALNSPQPDAELANAARPVQCVPSPRLRGERQGEGQSRISSFGGSSFGGSSFGGVEFFPGILDRRDRRDLDIGELALDLIET